MCGIVGFYNINESPETYPELICEMLSMITHRGPDEMGYYFDDRVAFGTARLSIIDLISGQQPISDVSERYWIVYSGEVYNYKELRSELEELSYVFRTNSDTEVVLNAFIAWREKSFIQLNGGFAFAIYDKKECKLYLVRDKFGERPLYYTNLNGQWYFASEIKSFIPHKNIEIDFDLDQLRSAFTIWTSLPDQTVYKNIHQVPIGSYVLVDEKGSAKIEPYYLLDFKTSTFSGSEDEAIERTREVLSDSVKIRLRSDVEVGTYLSGGIDSSITTYLATKLSNHTVRTFSIAFEDPLFDESKYQKEVSEYLGTKHSSLCVTNDHIRESFLSALWHAEVPVFRTAFVPMYLLSKMVQKEGIKVVLTGEGSDEFFLGYDLFKETLLRISWNSLSSEEKKSRLQILNPYEEFFQENAPKLMALYDRSVDEKIPGLFSHETRFNSSSFNTRILSSLGDGLNCLKKYLDLHKDEFNHLTKLQKSQYLESRTMLAGYLLSTQGDRMSFSHGVESRLPFLDPNVVNFACSLPIDLKLRNDVEEKYILKQAFKGCIPKSVIEKSKHAYRSPDAAAFLHTDKPIDYLSCVLSENELKKIDFINSDFVLKLIEKLKNTPKNQISHRENQTFIFLLSTVLLYKNFIKSSMYKPSKPVVEKLLKRKIDGRKITKAVLA